MIRIVKLTFQEDKVEDFLALFDQIQTTIRGFDGCLELYLLQDRQLPNVFFTYSIWKDDHYLQAYRQSAFFDETWRKTKALFAEKPAAWSVDKIR